MLICIDFMLIHVDSCWFCSDLCELMLISWRLMPILSRYMLIWCGFYVILMLICNAVCWFILILLIWGCFLLIMCWFMLRYVDCALICVDLCGYYVESCWFHVDSLRLWCDSVCFLVRFVMTFVDSCWFRWFYVDLCLFCEDLCWFIFIILSFVWIHENSMQITVVFDNSCWLCVVLVWFLCWFVMMFADWCWSVWIHVDFMQIHVEFVGINWFSIDFVIC